MPWFDPRSRFRLALPGCLIAAALLLGALGLGLGGAQAAVELLFFRARTDANRVFLEWQTGTEIDNSGYYVNRSQVSGSNYTRLHANIIPAEGDTLVGARYTYTDTTVTTGQEYWYRLEIIDTNGNSDLSDPLRVVAGATATPTASRTPTTTATGTATGTATATSPTGASATASPTATATTSGGQPATATQTATRTATATPRPDSGSGEETATPEISETPEGEGTPPAPEGGPTSTLVPFPTITIEIPLVTPTARLKVVSPDDQEAFPKEGDRLAGFDFGRYLPLVLIGLVWVVLGVWFVYLQRKAE